MKVGDRVYWTDPDTSSESKGGWGTIVAAPDEIEHDTVIALKMDDEGEVECFPGELSTTEPREEEPRFTVDWYDWPVILNDGEAAVAVFPLPKDSAGDDAAGLAQVELAKQIAALLNGTAEWPFKLWVLWGDSPEPRTKPEGYEFATKAERAAFIRGIEEMDGWLGYEIRWNDTPSGTVNCPAFNDEDGEAECTLLVGHDGDCVFKADDEDEDE